MRVPCKDCSDRFVSCHSSCDKYRSWKQDLDSIREKVLKEKMTNMMAEEFRQDSMLKMYKKHKST